MHLQPHILDIPEGDGESLSKSWIMFIYAAKKSRKYVISKISNR